MNYTVTLQLPSYKLILLLNAMSDYLKQHPTVAAGETKIALEEAIIKARG